MGPGVRVGLLAVVAGVFPTCTSDAIRENEVVHPTPENAPPSDAVSIRHDSLPVGLSRDALSAWKEARDVILGARPRLRLGVEGPVGPETFGRIWDVKIGPSGHVFVLDQQAQEIRIFDSSGGIVQVVGGIGDGPTEFRYANGIELLHDGRLAVSSQGSTQLKVFAELGNGWDLDEIVRVSTGPDDICSTNDGRVFIAGHKREDNTLVHEVAIQADSAPGGFGAGYQASDWLIQNQMADGWIACLANPHRVVFAYELLPMVRSFDPGNGATIWTARLEDFISPQVISRIRTDGRLGVRRGQTEVEDIVAVVHDIASAHLLIQVSRAQTRRRTITVRSYLVDAASGRGALLGDGAVLPPVVSTFEGGYVTIFEDPYPRLEVRTFQDDNL